MKFIKKLADLMIGRHEEIRDVTDQFNHLFTYATIFEIRQLIEDANLSDRRPLIACFHVQSLNNDGDIVTCSKILMNTDVSRKLVEQVEANVAEMSRHIVRYYESGLYGDMTYQVLVRQGIPIHQAGPMTLDKARELAEAGSHKNTYFLMENGQASVL